MQYIKCIFYLLLCTQSPWPMLTQGTHHTMQCHHNHREDVILSKKKKQKQHNAPQPASPHQSRYSKTECTPGLNGLMNWVFVLKLERHTSVGCDCGPECPCRDLKHHRDYCFSLIKLYLWCILSTHITADTLLSNHQDPNKSKWINDSLTGYLPRMNICMTKEGIYSNHLTTPSKKCVELQRLVY